MKKIISLVMCMGLILSLVACGQNQVSSVSAEAEAPAAEVAE